MLIGQLPVVYMPEKAEKVTIELSNMKLPIQLLSFRHDGNEEYVLVDTGCVLYLLRHFPSLVHRLENATVKLAIIEHTIKEVAKHLQKSLEEKKGKNAHPFGVLSGIENFRKILENERIRKVADPKIAKKDQPLYKRFGEDSPLVYSLYEGDFKAIATQDSPLAKKIPKKKFIPCQQLLKG